MALWFDAASKAYDVRFESADLGRALRRVWHDPGTRRQHEGFWAGWPPLEYYYDGTPPAQLSGEWIANLFPSLEDWRKGQRALFDTMFAEPARRAGVARWGIKEVRLGAEHCHYLRWLYPKA